MNIFHLKIKQILTSSTFAVVIITLYSGLVSPQIAGAILTPNAPTTYTVLAPLPCISDPNSTTNNTQGCVNGVQTTVNFDLYVKNTVNLAIAISAVLAVFMIVWGGFEYLTSTIPGTKSDGLKKAKNAVFGLLLVLCSYIILRTIDPRLVQIPSGLVPKLNLSSTLTNPANGAKSLTDALQDEANNQSADYQTANQNLTIAQNAAVETKNKLNSINQQIAAANGGHYYGQTIDDLVVNQECADAKDQTTIDLCNQRQAAYDTLGKQTNAGVVAQAQKDMAATMQDATAIAQNDTAGISINTPETIQAKIAHINDLYNRSVAQLSKNANPPDPDQKQTLDDQHNYALAVLNAQNFQAQNSLGSDNQDVVNGYINQIKDPDLKARATSSLQADVNNVAAKQKAAAQKIQEDMNNYSNFGS